jgi:hypothetical protein
MRHCLTLLAAATAMLLTSACGAAAPANVQAPPRATDVETQVSPAPRRRDVLPPLVAPPPAYGNKIVMARRGTTPTTN